MNLNHHLPITAQTPQNLGPCTYARSVPKCTSTLNNSSYHLALSQNKMHRYVNLCTCMYAHVHVHVQCMYVPLIILPLVISSVVFINLSKLYMCVYFRINFEGIHIPVHKKKNTSAALLELKNLWC